MSGTGGRATTSPLSGAAARRSSATPGSALSSTPTRSFRSPTSRIRPWSPTHWSPGADVVTAADVRAVAMSLPRTSEHLIHDHIKFRVGKIVYAAISPDESTMGVGFPKEERAALIASEPDKFAMPRLSDQRFHWVHARMTALGPDEMRELVFDAWRMVVPKKVAAAYLSAVDAAGRGALAQAGARSTPASVTSVLR